VKSDPLAALDTAQMAGGAAPPHNGMTHTAASMVVSKASMALADPFRRLKSGSLGRSGAVNLWWGHRTLWTLIFEVEHVMYSFVEVTWKVTGNTVSFGSVMVLLDSAAPGSY